MGKEDQALVWTWAAASGVVILAAVVLSVVQARRAGYHPMMVVVLGMVVAVVPFLVHTFMVLGQAWTAASAWAEVMVPMVYIGAVITVVGALLWGRKLVAGRR